MFRVDRQTFEEILSKIEVEARGQCWDSRFGFKIGFGTIILTAIGLLFGQFVVLLK
jgi:hypothetical protein